MGADPTFGVETAAGGASPHDAEKIPITTSAPRRADRNGRGLLRRRFFMVGSD
jgi:hypothetical protein